MHVGKVAWMNWLKNGSFLLVVLLLSYCADIHKSADFERHRYSQLSEPYDRNDVMYFDATFTVEIPDTEAGEAKRMEWLQAWLDQQNICAEGFEVVIRRPFEQMESNAARHDIRYEVKCSAE
jgi:hypothetical protein